MEDKLQRIALRLEEKGGAPIFAPDDMRQTALVFLPEDSGTVAPHHQLSMGT